MNGTNESSHGKDDEQKEMEPAEEEKRFEASNHMEGDLVDILGMDFIMCLTFNCSRLIDFVCDFNVQ